MPVACAIGKRAERRALALVASPSGGMPLCVALARLLSRAISKRLGDSRSSGNLAVSDGKGADGSVHASLSRKGVLSGAFNLIEFWDGSEFHWF
jgi:hypothetical protein